MGADLSARGGAGRGGAGLMGGVLAGLCGVGGGFILTPMLTVLFGLPMNVAVGTGLCQMVGASTAGAIRYSRLKVGEAKLGWVMTGGGVVGVQFGALVVHALTAMGTYTLAGGQTVPIVRVWLSAAYVLVLGVVAVWMAFDLRRPSLPAHLSRPPGPLMHVRVLPLTVLPRSGYSVSVPLAAYLGLVLGFLSGLLGIGGGVLLVPLLVTGFGMRIRAASGTGIVVLLATSLVGTLTHARMGHVALGVAMVLLVGSTVGSQVGAVLALRANGQRLRAAFVAFVACTAVAVAADLARLLAG